MDASDAVADAVEAACKIDGERLSVDLDAFERALKKAKVPIIKANKAALNAELQAVREAVRVQAARVRSATDPEPAQRRLAELQRREDEISETLWPREEVPA